MTNLKHAIIFEEDLINPFYYYQTEKMYRRIFYFNPIKYAPLFQPGNLGIFIKVTRQIGQLQLEWWLYNLFL